MQNIEVKTRQSFFDISLQECGSIDAVMILSERNGISITDHLTAGDTLQYAIEDIKKSAIVTKLRTFNAFPATELTNIDLTLISEGGIGNMKIETNFTVN